MPKHTAKALGSVAGPNAVKTSNGCCGVDQASGRMKWLMGAAVGLLLTGLVTGSVVLGFAAIAPLLYVLPCLVMCSICLFERGRDARS